MKLPDSGKKKALIVVDLQSAFLKPYNKHIIKNIQKAYKPDTLDIVL